MKDRRLKMIWNSNGAHIPSGYGVFQRDFLYRLLKDDWPVAQISFTGLEGSRIDYKLKDKILPMYPRMGDTWGSDAMVMHGKHFGANAVFSMQDVWTLQPQNLQQLPVWIPYVPIDKEPVPPGVLDRLKYAYKIITFSKFGQKALEKHGFASTMIYEGTDTEIFKPMDKAKARKELNLPPTAFICGMVGANKPDGIARKGWQQALDAFFLFQQKHPEAIYFYEVNQPGGFDVLGYAKYLGMEKKIFFIDQYMSVFHADSPVINKMINAFDILLHPSTTEGFGLVIIESQSAGTPVIVNNCCSMPELVLEGKTGEICQTGFKQWSPDGGYIHYADVNSLYEKMEKLFTDLQQNEAKIRSACRNHIIDKFDIVKIVDEQWTPFFLRLQLELLGKPDIMDANVNSSNKK